MASRPTWFWTSLFSSVGVNAVLLTSSACWLYSQTPVYIPGYARGEAVAPIYFELPPQPPQDTLLGQSDGKGDAVDASAGETPMEAALGPQGQAFLSRDPEGPGKLAQDPSMSTQIPGENGNGGAGSAAMFGAATPSDPQSAPKFDRKQSPPDQQQSPADQAAAAQALSLDTPPPQASPQQPPAKQPPPEQARPDQTPPQQIPPQQAVAEQPPPDQTAQVDPSTKLPPTKPREFGREPKVDPPIADNPIADNAVASAGDQLAPAAPPAAVAVAMANPSTSSPPAQPQMQSPASGKPGPPVAPADPAPQSPTESDPFSKNGAVKFKSGSTDIQFGRKHKIVRPRLGLGAQTDMLSLRPPITLVLALSLDETGKVVRVQILKSSGSNDIDQACKVAAYQWWLEPSKDKSGKPVRDVVPFSIGFS